MYKKILAPIDGSPASSRGLQEAIKLAKDQDAELRVLHVINEWLLLSPDAADISASSIGDNLRAGAKVLLDEAEARVRDADLIPNTVLLEQIGMPVGGVIVKHAEDWQADLIVCGTHGRRGMRRLVMGSDAEYILRRAKVPVLLLRHPDLEEAQGKGRKS